MKFLVHEASLQVMGFRRPVPHSARARRGDPPVAPVPTRDTIAEIHRHFDYPICFPSFTPPTTQGSWCYLAIGPSWFECIHEYDLIRNREAIFQIVTLEETLLQNEYHHHREVKQKNATPTGSQKIQFSLIMIVRFPEAMTHDSPCTQTPCFW
jgi:hypothetical protein